MDDRSTAPGDAGVDGRRAGRRSSADDPRRRAGLPRRPRAARQHRLRQLHAGRRRRGRRVRRRRSSRDSARDGRGPTRSGRPPRRRRSSGRSRGTAGRAAAPADRPHGHGLRRRDRRRAAVRIDGRDRLRARRHRHEVGPARRALRASGRSSIAAGRRPAVRAARRSSPTRTRRSARRRSTPHIRELAADADVCLVLECARANGDIVSSRKGILDARLTVHGRAAHAGVEPEKGRSAILAAADLVRDLHALNGRWPGVTVNVGVIAGGTRPNVVAERCVARGRRPGDRRRADLEAAEAAIRDARSRRPSVPDTTVERRARCARWWPMEKLERSGPARRPRRQALAGRLGFEVKDTATGGASDANTTSGHGRPDARRPRPDRRQRSLAGGVPRGRLDRAADALLAGLLLAVGARPGRGAWRPRPWP